MAKKQLTVDERIAAAVNAAQKNAAIERDRGVKAARLQERSALEAKHAIETAELLQRARAEALRQIQHAAEQGRALGRQQMLDERATGYLMGVGGKKRCGAVARKPKDWPKGMAFPKVTCQREPEHPLGPYDRHKAVFGDPHIAVSWND